MTVAVCALCGAIKHGAFTPCGEFGQTPKSDIDLAYSLALTDHYFRVDTLQEISDDFKKTGERPHLSPDQEAQMLSAALETKKMMGPILNTANEKSKTATKKQFTDNPTQATPQTANSKSALATVTFYYLAVGAVLGSIMGRHGARSLYDKRRKR